ncbi:MAG: hypothetical protein CXR30_17950 [Geobacter sp.]|nr:MAG: hypothetical protein CXR30_17950 [Geobacter sp.]
MKRVLIAGLVLCTLATSAQAGQKVYLKDGGIIQAKAVWRSHGMVHVLINRDTLPEFAPNELDMKRTFPKHHREARKKRPGHKHQAKTAAPDGAAVSETSGDKTSGISLPKLPNLSDMNPVTPSSGGKEGSIRKYNRELIEKTNE